MTIIKPSRNLHSFKDEPTLFNTKITIMNDLSHINNDFVAKCIETGELQLTEYEQRSHFTPVKYLLIISIVFFGTGVIEILMNGFAFDINSIGFGLLLSSLCFLLFSYLVYRMQKNVLQFFSFETDLTSNEKRKIVNSVGEKLNWEKVFDRNNTIIFKAFNLFLWGEQITVIFHGKNIMLSSISDPSKKTNLFAPNHKHINTFIDEFEKGMVK